MTGGNERVVGYALVDDLSMVITGVFMWDAQLAIGRASN